MDGVAYGPWSFDVAQDGSIWLLDEVNHRVAPDHTIYATYVPPPGPGLRTLRLAALDPGGHVRWTAPTTVEIFNAQLRIGPDNALYVYGGQPGHRWTPLTTPAGRPLSVADQRRRTSPQQPLAGGLRLAARRHSPGEWHITLSDQAGQVVGGWRISSRTQLGSEGATPALVGGDPVVVVEVVEETSREFLHEYEILRLARAGGTSQRFAIAPAGRVNWGDVPITGVRIGPDGQLYQLRTSRTGGVDIARHSLTPDKETPPTTAPAPGPTTPEDPPVDNGGVVTAPTVSLPPAQPAEPAASDAAARRLLPGLAGVGAGTLAGLGMWLLYRRRHPTAG